MSKSLTEAAKAVLEGKSQIEEGIYPEVSPGKISNPNPVDPSTASTGNAKTLKPKSKASEDRHSQNGAVASGTEDFPLPQDLGGATPTSTAKENLGAKASTSKDTTRSSKANVAGEKMKRMGSQPAMAEEMEDDGEVFEEETTLSLAERLKALKEAKKMEKNEDEDDEKCDEEFELSEELEDFINEGIELGLSEEEILAAIDENFEFISEDEDYLEEDELDEVSKGAAIRAYGASQDPDRDDSKTIRTGERLKKHIVRKFGKETGEHAERHADASHYGRSPTMMKADDRLPKKSPSSSMRTTKSGKLNKQDTKSLGSNIKSRLGSHTKANLPEEYDLDENYYDAFEDYQVDMQEHVDALLEGENLSEEFHAKATTIFEAAVKSKLEEEVALLEQAYAETLEERVAQIEEELTSQVDDYLNYVVEQWIEENEVAVESALRSELTEDFISGLRHLFAEHYIDVPEEEVSVVEELSTTVEELEAKLNEEIQRNVELTSMLSESRKLELTSAVCEGLTATQAEKLKSLIEGVDYTSDEEFIDKISTLRENYFPVSAKNDAVLDSVESGDPQSLNENLEGPMAKYVQALGRSLPN